MLRIFMPIVFLLVFIGWIAYQGLVKKDLSKQLNNLYAGVAFIGVWAVVYFVVLK